jgi:ankyrin repeat protein
MKANKIIWMALAILLGVGTGTAGAATNEVSALLQQGLFEEEANQNLDAAIQAYQAVIAQTDKDRQFAATAIFRLGECYRKQGKTNEAAAQYQRILRDFADRADLAKLSQQDLAGMGMPVPGPAAAPAISDAALQTQKQLLDEAIKVFEQQLESQQARAKEGVLSSDELSLTQQKLIEFKRQLAALDAGLPVQQQTTLESSDEDKELARIQQMVKDSPDWINVPVAGGDPPLISAAESDHLRVAEYLLDHNADVNVKGRSSTPLTMAAIWGRKAMVEFLLNRGADANARDSSGGTALLTATENGFQAVVEVLLAHHADVNVHYTKVNGEDTPLHKAAQRGYTNLVALLLENGADPNAVNANGSTPLHTAAAAGNTAIMGWLLAHKAEVDARDNAGLTPLYLAVQADQLDAASLLLKNKADPNLLATDGTGQPGKGWSPLHVAVAGDQIGMVKLLLEHGAKTDATIPVYAYQFTQGRGYAFSPLGGNGMRPFGGFGGNATLLPGDEDVTPLTMAVMNGRKEMVQLLIEHHADVNAKAGAGDSPLMMVAKMDYPNGGGQPTRDRLGIAELLLDNGAEVNLQNDDHESALSLAVNNNLPDLVKLLLAHKPKVDILDKDGLTPLQRTVYPHQVDIAGMLLDAGANPNVKYPKANAPTEWMFGLSLLEAAVHSGDRRMVEVLLAHKADPNAQDDSGGTPLSEAKRLESDPAHAQAMGEIAVLLRNAGANDNLQRLSFISVSRAGANYEQTIFHKEAGLPNHYSLLELMAAFYAPPYRGRVPLGQNSLDLKDPPGLAFPDFGSIKISRLQKDGRTNAINVDLETAFEAGDCSKDVPLEWGDIVEIPEADHNVNDTWAGLSKQAMAALRKCLARQVVILVKSQTNLVSLKPIIYRRTDSRFEGGFGTGGIYLTTGSAEYGGNQNSAFTTPRGTPNAQSSFWLYDVVHDANVILTSSDLSRVKISRADAATRKPVEMVFDLQKQDPANELWLRDGDVIEIPEKP